MKKYLIILVCVFILTGCADTKSIKPSIDSDIKEKKHIPEKIVTFSPVVIDFLNDYDIDIDVLSSNNLPKRLEKIADDLFSVDPFFVADKNKIKEFKPEYIFLSSNDESILTQISGFGRIMKLNPMDENYYENLKSNYTMLANIFDKSKDVNYDLMYIDEKKKLLEEKAQKYGFTYLLDDYFIRKHKNEDIKMPEFDDEGKKFINIDDTSEDNFGNLNEYKSRIDKIFNEIEKEIKNVKRNGASN